MIFYIHFVTVYIPISQANSKYNTNLDDLLIRNVFVKHSCETLQAY